MKIFKHKGSGHYIGSVVIVRKETLLEAEVLIRKWLDDCGLKDESLNVKEWVDEDKGGLIYAQNGDY